MRHSTSLHRALGHGPGEPSPRPPARTGGRRAGSPPSRHELAWVCTAAGSATAAGGAALLLAGAGAARGPLLLLVPAAALAVPCLQHRLRPAPTRRRQGTGGVVGAGERVVAVLVALLLLPAIVLIAAALKVTGRGPALVQEAHRDRDGRLVLSSRFRTGTDGRTPGTGLGAFLRRSGLDELPRVLDAARGGVPFLRLRRG